MKFAILMPKLVIQSVQLFVGGLQLFLRRFQLFVGALQLLVCRNYFLVGRLKLLPEGVLRFDRRPQGFLRTRPLALNPLKFARACPLWCAKIASDNLSSLQMLVPVIGCRRTKQGQNRFLQASGRDAPDTGTRPESLLPSRATRCR